jgi:hypothetical protein
VNLVDGTISYDYVIVATGATHSYFGHDEYEAVAPGLKSIENALEMRRRVLLAYEAAERADRSRPCARVSHVRRRRRRADGRRARGRARRDLTPCAQGRLPVDRSERGEGRARRGPAARA